MLLCIVWYCMYSRTFSTRPQCSDTHNVVGISLLLSEEPQYVINMMVSCVNSFIPDERQCFNTHHGIERIHIGSVRDCFREGIMVYCFPWNAYDLHGGSRVQSGAHCRFANGLRPVARAHQGEPGMVFPFFRDHYVVGRSTGR